VANDLENKLVTEAYVAPQYTMSFDDDEGKVTKGAEASPETLNNLTQKVLNSATAPEIGPVPDTYVKLPAGMVTADGIVREAEVQELTGEHEEALAKARQNNNPARFVQTLLTSGVVSVGGQKVTAKQLTSLLQGDIDALLLGIRKATFGNEFVLEGMPCPHCGEENDLNLNLDDIPMNEMEADREVEIPLRFNRKAKVTFPTGEVQADIYKNANLTAPELVSILLSHCLLGFTEADGTFRPSNGMTDVKKMGKADRDTLNKYIYENQPGPRYDEVKAACHACESEVEVPLNVGLLFQEL
jgi:hypothetical protein